MSITSLLTGEALGAHPVAAGVEAVSALLDEAVGGGLWSLPDEDLLALLEAQERAAAKMTALGLALVREADGRDLAARAGAASTAALLRCRLRLRPCEAKARVELAAAVHGPMAATGQALAAGDISGDHARVVRRAVRALPTELPAGVAREAEAALVGFAAEFDPGDLARLGEHLGHVIDPEELADKERRALKARELTFIDQGDGTHRIRGVLDNEAVAKLRAAIDALSAPRSSAEPDSAEPDSSEPSSGEPSSSEPSDAGASDAGTGASGDGRGDSGCGGTGCSDVGDTGAGAGAGLADSSAGSAADDSAGSAGADGGGSGMGRRKVRDPRSPAERRADALVELADMVLDRGWLPASGGVRPHISITATIETLLRLAGAPAADADHVGPLSAEALRRLCCDSWISRVLLGERGVPLDVGREHRLVPPGLRRAVVARDRCCTFPGCDRPASWCIAHHIIHWVDGGPTSLENLALLCQRHHTLIHHGDWAVRLGPDQLPEFIPPPWIDPDRTPRRNPYTLRPPDLLRSQPLHTLAA
jgi:Domain of unknown function (DUF222)/HNH endonuclease